jgi:methionine aminopeptidase
LKTAADIVHQVAKKLIELCVEGAKIIDLCIEGDKLIEQGTGAVYNKAVKGVRVTKGKNSKDFGPEFSFDTE